MTFCCGKLRWAAEADCLDGLLLLDSFFLFGFLVLVVLC